MLVLGFKAGGMMNLHVEDGVSEHAQHWNGDTKGYQIIYAKYVPPTVLPVIHNISCMDIIKMIDNNSYSFDITR